jgi:hypothetical protein
MSGQSPCISRGMANADTLSGEDSMTQQGLMADDNRKPISPAAHAVLDYTVAATFFGVGAMLASRHRPAATLAFINGAMVAGMSMLTDYPGGLLRILPFRGHRAGDIMQAALAGMGPVLFGFAGDKEANFFYGQAASEAGVIAATDWDAQF